ncbi:MAG: hypothetical protein KF723_01285 [Rhizobiaceae bacterium]|nr:hypothetical protein [Rhizobiaceae bacterium]
MLIVVLVFLCGAAVRLSGSRRGADRSVGEGAGDDQSGVPGPVGPAGFSDEDREEHAEQGCDQADDREPAGKHSVSLRFDTEFANLPLNCP